MWRNNQFLIRYCYSFISNKKTNALINHIKNEREGIPRFVYSVNKVMKEASRLLYKVGNVINVIGIVLAIILAICCFIGYNGIDQSTANEMGKTLSEAQALCMGSGIFLVICVIVWIVIYVIAKKAIKALNDDSTSITPHVLMIVIGVLGQSIFYLLGGIFGVIAENKNRE